MPARTTSVMRGGKYKLGLLYAIARDDAPPVTLTKEQREDIVDVLSQIGELLNGDTRKRVQIPTSVAHAFAFMKHPEVLDGLGGHLYLVEVEDVCVKVGFTQNPISRIKEHQRAIARMNRRVGRVWVTHWHENAKFIETEMRGGRRNEYLEITFDDAVEKLVTTMASNDNI